MGLLNMLLRWRRWRWQRRRRRASLATRPSCLCCKTGRVREIEFIGSFDQPIVALLIIVWTSLALLAVFHRVRGTFEDFRRSGLVPQPRDEHRPQGLRRNLLAVMSLEQPLHPTRPSRALHGSIGRPVWRVEQEGLITTHLKLERVRILVQDGSERIRKRCGKGAICGKRETRW
jgi:hypothetical protein